MPRPYDPAAYADTHHELLAHILVSRPARIRIRVTGTHPNEFRLQFYAFRAAWRRYWQSAFERNDTKAFDEGRTNYEALVRYEARIEGDSVILIHRATIREEIIIEGEKVEDTVNASAYRPRPVEEKTKKNKGVSNLRSLSPMLPPVGVSEEQLKIAAESVEKKYEEILGFTIPTTPEEYAARLEKSLAEAKRRNPQENSNDARDNNDPEGTSRPDEPSDNEGASKPTSTDS